HAGEGRTLPVELAEDFDGLRVFPLSVEDDAEIQAREVESLINLRGLRQGLGGLVQSVEFEIEHAEVVECADVLRVCVESALEFSDGLLGLPLAHGLHRTLVRGARVRRNSRVETRHVYHFVRRRRRPLVRVEEDRHVCDAPAQKAYARSRRVEGAPVALDGDHVVVYPAEVARELKLPLRVREDGLDATVVARECKTQLARGPVAVGHENLDGGRGLSASNGRGQHESDYDRAAASPRRDTGHGAPPEPNFPGNARLLAVREPTRSSFKSTAELIMRAGLL